MPKFSQESFSKLSTCHPDLQALFYEVIKNFDCVILEGYRNQQEQDLAYSEGRSKLQWPNGKHNHQPSMAVDVTPYPVNFSDIKRLYWFAGYVMGIAQKLKDDGKMSHSVKFGGDWNGNVEDINQHFRDMQHFEIVL
jgi:peptidoglycan L-alanyl-D-glutamate endopeptidase CwlK